MNSGEVAIVIADLRRAVPGYSAWAMEEILSLAQQNGTSVEEEKQQFRRRWEAALGGLDAEHAQGVVSRLASGQLAIPPFGSLPLLIRSAASDLSRGDRVAREMLARRQQSQQQREQLASEPPFDFAAGLEAAGDLAAAAFVRSRRAAGEAKPATKKRRWSVSQERLAKSLAAIVAES